VHDETAVCVLGAADRELEGPGFARCGSADSGYSVARGSTGHWSGSQHIDLRRAAGSGATHWVRGPLRSRRQQHSRDQTRRRGTIGPGPGSHPSSSEAVRGGRGGRVQRVGSRESSMTPEVPWRTDAGVCQPIPGLRWTWWRLRRGEQHMQRPRGTVCRARADRRVGGISERYRISSPATQTGTSLADVASSVFRVAARDVQDSRRGQVRLSFLRR
jgi:hypothetical protein